MSDEGCVCIIGSARVAQQNNGENNICPPLIIQSVLIITIFMPNSALNSRYCYS